MGIGSCNKFNNTMNVDVVCCVVSTVDILMWLLVFLSFECVDGWGIQLLKMVSCNILNSFRKHLSKFIKKKIF